MHPLQSSIESLIGSSVEHLQAQNNLAVLEDFLHALNVGEIRAATCDESGTWTVHQWVKQGILMLFKVGVLQDMSISGMPFFDKHTIRGFG